MSKVNEIIDGWKNYLFIEDSAIQEIIDTRAELCAACPIASFGKHLSVLPDYRYSEIQGHYCDKEKGGCGCPISTAIRSKDKKCPVGKW